MPLYFNENYISTVKYNNKFLKKIIINGKTVYDKTNLILPPELSIVISDAERQGYAQASLSCYNPNDFAVNIIVDSFKVGSVSKNWDFTTDVVFYSVGEGGGNNRVGAKRTAHNAMLVYNNLNELAVPYGGCLTVHFESDDGRVSNSITVLHDDWNSTVT